MGALQRMVEWFEAHEVFKRQRTYNETQAMGMLLYRSGLGCGKATQLLEVSHTAVWEWYHPGEGALRLPEGLGSPEAPSHR